MTQKLQEAKERRRQQHRRQDALDTKTMEPSKPREAPKSREAPKPKVADNDDRGVRRPSVRQRSNEEDDDRGVRRPRTERRKSAEGNGKGKGYEKVQERPAQRQPMSMATLEAFLADSDDGGGADADAAPTTVGRKTSAQVLQSDDSIFGCVGGLSSWSPRQKQFFCHNSLNNAH
mmetsp:Transcript_11436/g.23902  ORF Transcript_11436/g.23902 Transcript_11436/m.23902 type:complete len:175 (-) Transcript_11436:13-537(-)